MAIARLLTLYVFGPLGFWTMAPLHYAAKLDPFLSLDCTPRPPPWHNPRKGRDQILPSGNHDARSDDYFLNSGYNYGDVAAASKIVPYLESAGQVYKR